MSMGEGMERARRKKLRVLCLHGFRTSGSILQKQIGKWDKSVLERLDLWFPDAPFPARGKSDVEGYFPPPYYEWFQFNEDFTEYVNMDKCFSYIEDYMIKHGPFDGLLGFSQGAVLSAGLVGLQANGLALTKVPSVRFVIIVGGAKFKAIDMQEVAYSSATQCPSVHFLGEKDFLKPHGEELLTSFVDPFVIRHPMGHTVPRLDEQGLKTMTSFLGRVEEYILDKASCNGNTDTGAVNNVKPTERSESLQLEEKILEANGTVCPNCHSYV